MVNTQGRESGGSWFETCPGVWYPRRRPCGVAINTNILAGGLGTPSFYNHCRDLLLSREDLSVPEDPGGSGQRAVAGPG